MTIDDQFPAFIGFSQADAFDYLHQFGPRVDVRRQEDEVCEYRAHLQQGGFWTFSYRALETIGRGILRA